MAAEHAWRRRIPQASHCRVGTGSARTHGNETKANSGRGNPARSFPFPAWPSTERREDQAGGEFVLTSLGDVLARVAPEASGVVIVSIVFKLTKHAIDDQDRWRRPALGFRDLHIHLDGQPSAEQAKVIRQALNSRTSQSEPHATRDRPSER
jgi:hypothetical protein